MNVYTPTANSAPYHHQYAGQPGPAQNDPEPQDPCDQCEISTGKKVANAAAWAIAGAVVVGVVGTSLVAGSVQGPDALGAFLLAPAFAGAGGIAGAVAGWKIMS